MSPNNELVQYIENEAFKGRRVEDVIADVRNAGWTDDLIQEAVQTLNEEHDVLEQLDIDPLSRKRVHSHSTLMIIYAAVVTVLFSLFVAGVVREIQKPGFLGFVDPNVTMMLPDDWTADTQYLPGILMTNFYSSEYNEQDARKSAKAARMTFYADAEEDAFGTLIREGGSGMSIVSEKVAHSTGVTRELTEFIGTDPENGSRQVHGVHAYITKGRVSMSATIYAERSHWKAHAEEAEKIVISIEPQCGRQALSAEKKSNGTLFICGNQPEVPLLEN